MLFACVIMIIVLHRYSIIMVQVTEWGGSVIDCLSFAVRAALKQTR